MRQNAAYESCLARDMSGRSCGAAPSCSTACSGGGGNASNGPAAAVGQAIPGGVQPRGVDAVGAFLSLLGNPAAREDSATPPSPGPDPATAVASERQKIDAAAATLMQESNNVPATSTAPESNTPAGPGPPAGPGASESAGDGPSGFGSVTATDPAATTSLAADGGTTGSASPAAQPSPPLPSASASSAIQDSAADEALPPRLAPTDPQMNGALQQSSDQSTPDSASTFAAAVDSPAATADDGLGGLSTPTPSLAVSIMTDPIVQWVTSDRGNLTRVPLPAPGDDPDSATNKVFGQSIVGFGDLLKGLARGPVGFASAVSDYNSKMIEQMGADLGFANAQIFSNTGGDHP